MKKKRNILKRNSGFIVGCVLAAGASFLTADLLMTDMITLVTPQTGTTEAESEGTIEPEKVTVETYETDPFTVTASGNVIKGIEEVPETEAQTEEKTMAETDADGNPVNTEEGFDDASGNGSDSSGDESNSGDSGDDGSYSSDNDGNYGDSSYSNGNSDDGSYSSGNYSDSSYSGGNYSDNSYSDGGYDIEITDPGNGEYTYSGDSGSGSGNTGGSTSSAWTPDDVILWGISSRYIDVSELYPYGPATLRLIRNEIFALHGRIFRDQELMNYFSQKSWYVPTYEPDDFDANMFYYLNDYEKANLQVILDYETWYAENY